jgi:hypothetical protein
MKAEGRNSFHDDCVKWPQCGITKLHAVRSIIEFGENRDAGGFVPASEVNKLSFSAFTADPQNTNKTNWAHINHGVEAREHCNAGVLDANGEVDHGLLLQRQHHGTEAREVLPGQRGERDAHPPHHVHVFHLEHIVCRGLKKRSGIWNRQFAEGEKRGLASLKLTCFG